MPPEFGIPVFDQTSLEKEHRFNVKNDVWSLERPIGISAVLFNNLKSEGKLTDSFSLYDGLKFARPDIPMKQHSPETVYKCVGDKTPTTVVGTTGFTNPCRRPWTKFLNGLLEVFEGLSYLT